MPNEKSLSQNDVSRFLLGLGIGLVVGFIFKPPSNDYSRRFRESATTTTRRSGYHW
jgi:hypothetical protein